MKTRIGFVSNSSSSSFIIQYVDTTAEAAISMLEFLINEWETEYKSDKQVVARIKDAEKAVTWLKDNTSYDGPIHIPWTCNYDTYIAKVQINGEYVIAVETSNNHIWNESLDIIYGFENQIQQAFEHQVGVPSWKLESIDEYREKYDAQFFNIANIESINLPDKQVNLRLSKEAIAIFEELGESWKDLLTSYLEVNATDICDTIQYGDE